MVHLTRHRQEIVDCESKYYLVAANAGRGKTLVLAKRIEKLLGSMRRGEKILALTYTSKAARELRERLLDTYSEEELTSKVIVGTIRSFCAKFVARRGSTIGFPYGLHVLENVEDRLAILADAVEAVPQVRSRVNDMRALKQLFEDVERAKRSWAFRSQFFEDAGNRMVLDEYRAEMLNQHAIDADDTLAYTAQILIERPSLATLYQKIYRYIRVDEAQNLNDAQYQVIQALAGDKCGIMMAGDPRQSIYGFSGSTVSIMMERFPKDYHPVARFTLEENFRSSRAAVPYARAIESSSHMTPKLVIEEAWRTWMHMRACSQSKNTPRGRSGDDGERYDVGRALARPTLFPATHFDVDAT